MSRWSVCGQASDWNKVSFGPTTRLSPRAPPALRVPAARNSCKTASFRTGITVVYIGHERPPFAVSARILNVPV
jgi:hypothetical protein